MRFSHDQWFFLDVFTTLENRDRNRDKANEIVPSYFKAFFSRGLLDIGTLFTLTTATGISNFYARPNGAWKWYAAGTALAFFHMAFVPFVSKSHLDSEEGANLHSLTVSFLLDVVYKVQSLVEDEPKGQGLKTLREWLRVHNIRSWLADIPAWACFTIACLKSLQPL